MRGVLRTLVVATCWVCCPSTVSPSGSPGAVDVSSWGVLPLWGSEQADGLERYPRQQRACLDKLRGGGKGGCKAKHLSTAKEGRRIMMGRHAFPNLNLGARHGLKGKVTSRSLTTVNEPTARNVQTTSTAMKDDDDGDSEESMSSWEVQEMNRRMEKRVRTMREILPENGLVPLTNLGSKELGALELLHTYKGRPIKILRRPRPPEWGNVWSWGSNYDGQLGIADGCKIDRWSPTLLPFLPDGVIDKVVAGAEHTLLLRNDGRVFGCGLNACGQLGDGNTTAPRREFVPSSAIKGRVEAVAAGALHSLAVLRSGEVIAWGSNSSGQIGPSRASVWGRIDADPRGLLESVGLRDLTDEQVESMAPTLIEALQEEQDMIARGLLPRAPKRELNTELALKKRRRWWFKLAASEAICQPVVVDGVGCSGAHTLLAAGSTFSLARGPDGLVQQWGTLPWEAGMPGSGYRPIPSAVDNLPSTVVGLWAGDSHCLAVLEGGELLSWGSNAVGQLGDATDGNRSSAAQVMSGVRCAAAGGNVSMALMEDGEVFVWGGVGASREPTKVALHGRGAAVATGGGTCMVLLEDGSVWAWGQNERGQCGRGARKGPPVVRVPARVKGLRSDAVGITVGKRHTLAVTREGAALMGTPAPPPALPSTSKLPGRRPQEAGPHAPPSPLPVS